MFQDPYASLDPRMRVKEIISEPLDIARRGTSKERTEAVRSLLDEVGLAYDVMDRYPHEFSGGQRQRLGLARALALNPKLIVADEPVSALDVSIRSQILNLMKRLQTTHGLTYIVISHDLSVVRYLADRIGVMYLGKLVEIGTGADIYDEAGAPVHGGPARGDPGAESRAGASDEARRGDPGRASLSGQPAVRLSLPDSLPARSGEVRGGRPRAAVLRRRALRRVPLPAPAAGGRAWNWRGSTCARRGRAGLPRRAER